MAAKAQSKDVAAESTEATEFRWTKAQMRHFNSLGEAVAQAQRDLETAQQAQQKFVNYLTEEYELDPDLPWGIGPRGFMLRSDEAETGGDDATPDGGDDGGDDPAEPVTGIIEETATPV